jgi:diguanylate cyclase (GGDEF)-like protein/PAS domain S-box-containing protein
VRGSRVSGIPPRATSDADPTSRVADQYGGLPRPRAGKDRDGASRALLQAIFDNAPSGILLADMAGAPAGRLVRVNRAMCRITGYNEQQLLGMSVSDLTHVEHLAAHRLRFQSLATGVDAPEEAERRWVHADGNDIWVQFNVSTMHVNGRSFLIGLVEDITTRKAAEERLNHLALHDALTQLPNRLLLLDRLGHALSASVRSGRPVAVLYLDLDGFKTINDMSGHLVGDELLVLVATRLRSSLRPGDTVARIGGDEFVMVCPEVDDDGHARAVADRLLAVLREPYTQSGQTYHLTASMGVAVSRHGSTAPALLREADDAMYAAKDEGKNRLHRSDVNGATMTRTARAVRHRTIETELGTALQRDELVMYGQPVFSLPRGHVMAVETLIRWQHPTRGLLAPGEFLDVAETSPLMNDIGRRVLRESCRMATGWRAEMGHPPPDVYVNISGRQLESGTLRTDVLDALESSGLSGRRLVLELTETFTPLIGGSLREDLDDLRLRGVRLAIDDVGTGYSSLSRLTELPVDVLKIDRTFVAQIGQNLTCDAVIKAILNIGETLDLHIVAEGVETIIQARLLTEYGCDTAQGFLFCPPKPEEGLADILHMTGTLEPFELLT